MDCTLPKQVSTTAQLPQHMDSTQPPLSNCSMIILSSGWPTFCAVVGTTAWPLACGRSQLPASLRYMSANSAVVQGKLQNVKYIVQLGARPGFPANTLPQRRQTAYDGPNDLKIKIRVHLVAKRIAVGVSSNDRIGSSKSPTPPTGAAPKHTGGQTKNMLAV